VEVITDPRELFGRFQRSTRYREAFDAFYHGKRVAEDVTHEERRRAFEDSEKAKAALVAFARTEVAFVYAREDYAPASRAAIDDYIGAVRRQQGEIGARSSAGAGRETLEALDAERTRRHVELADTLVENREVPNRLMGRTLGRLILIDRGLDSVEGALEPFVDGASRALR